MRTCGGRKPPRLGDINAMSIFHLTVKRGSRAENRLSVDKHDYIARLGRFAKRHDGELAYSESGNMPSWAIDDPREFWAEADSRERSNGTLYHEAEFALPRELTMQQQIESARELAQQICADQHPYFWGLHDKEGNPHVHLMFSGRMLDGIERSQEQFFKRSNAKNPERGGCRKESSGDARGPEWVKQVRRDWQDIANRHLAAAGHDSRIDHRSNKARGLDEAPGVHLGRHATRLEQRGKPTWRGIKNRQAEHLNASLREVRSQIHNKENSNEQRPGRPGKPYSKQQHRVDVAGIAATPKRAFTAWRNDRAEDRPGLRVGRCFGPERMPVLRQTRAGNGHPETRHAVLQGTIQRSGGDHRGMQRLPAGGGFYAVESLDRRQAYKASLLQVRYQQQIQAVLAARLAYVDCQQDRIAITLIGGGRVTDHGDRLLTGAGRNQEISAALSLAQSKGWKTLSLSGDDDFKRRAWLEVVRAGLNVVGYEPSPELRAQFHKEKPMLGQAGAGGMMALTPDETMASPSPAASRWLEPLHEAREKLEAERRAIRLQLEGQRSIDLKKLELDLAKQHGGAEYDQVLRNFQAAAAASKDASAFIRIRAESRKEKAWRFLQLAHTKALATPAAAEALAEAREANEMHERLSGRLIPLNFGIGEIDHFQRDIRNGHDPEIVFTKAWRSRQLRPLQLWQELVIQPMFEAAKEQEKARKKAEAEASELARHTQQQEQLYREVDAQKRADELLDVMRTPGLTAAQEETLQDQHRYYTALADGYDDAEARERAAKKTNAPRPR